MILALLDTMSTGYLREVDSMPQTAHYSYAYSTACTDYDRPRSSEFTKAMRLEWLNFTRGNGWSQPTGAFRQSVRARSLLRQRVTPCARMVRRVAGARPWRSMKTIRRQERRAMQPLG